MDLSFESKEPERAEEEGGETAAPPLPESWDDFDLPLALLSGIYSAGFERPSPIQQKAIRPIMEGKDVLAQAQSGTGKTATFSIGALSRVDVSVHALQVIILSPTKELTIQTCQVAKQVGSKMDELRVSHMYNTQVPPNENHVLCGCPGKVLHALQRNQLYLDKFRLLVLDEADELLSEGFRDQIKDIVQYLPSSMQVVLVSATVPDSIMPIVNALMRNPVHIVVRREQLTLEGIRQYFVALHLDDHKYSTLLDLYKYLTVSQCIIYCNSVDRVQRLCDRMQMDGYAATCLHSRMEKEDRDAAFAEFRSGRSRVLISSDITARGIDVQQVSIVINYDLPMSVDTYLHRIGRSGRWGRKGLGINFVLRRDVAQLRAIETHYATKIHELPQDVSRLTAI